MVWSSLSSRSLREGSLTALLRRSGSAPLKMNLDFRRRNWKELCICLKGNIGRIVSIKIRTSQQLRLKGRRELADALAQPAPLLRVLRLDDLMDQYNALIPEPRSLFGSSAPALYAVKLHTDLSVLTQTTLPTVTILSAVNTRSARATDLEVLTRTFPCLQDLTFTMERWDWDHVPGRLVHVPPSVQSLTLVSKTPTVDPGDLLRLIDHQSVPFICVWYSSRCTIDDVDASAALDELAAFAPVTSMRINTGALPAGRTDGPGHGFIQMWAGEERGRPHRMVLYYPIAAPPSEALFANLTRLLVGEIVLAESEPWPPATALQELTVQALAPQFQKSDGHRSVFLLPRDRQRVLSCPSLRKLTFGSRRHDCVLRFPPHLAVDFVRYHLDAPVLDTIAIKGMKLVTNILEDVVELLSLAHDFVVENDHIVEIDW
ncbi:hypothetical protein AURDEDRAFT_182924 [Auricularia subglabra TFB-10046 SS5]|nr:hypothetical protein AURDEDRAFT_182924 [Auricularia subglabra TFB-10046 SS5]